MNLSESLIEKLKKLINEFGIILSVLILEVSIFFRIEILPLIESLILVIPAKYRLSRE